MIKVNANLFAAAAVAMAKDDVRYYLNGVLIAPAEEGCFIVATDGHRMVVIKDDDGLCEEDTIITVPKNIFTQCKQKKADSIEFKGNEVGELHNYNDTTLFRYEVIDGRFPNWRTVLPEEKDLGGNDATFDAKYLQDIGVIGKLLQFANNSAYSQVRVLSSGKTNGLFTFNSQCLYLVMQMRTDNDQFSRLPEWLKEKS